MFSFLENKNELPSNFTNFFDKGFSDPVFDKQKLDVNNLFNWNTTKKIILRPLHNFKKLSLLQKKHKVDVALAEIYWPLVLT